MWQTLKIKVHVDMMVLLIKVHVDMMVLLVDFDL
jgi:hypothetical protein